MPGRHLCSDEEAAARGFGDSGSRRRRRVLQETLAAFNRCDPSDRYHRIAAENLARWRARAGTFVADRRVAVIPGDWGSVAHKLTLEHGLCFAVLNMANAEVPGGAYVEGAIAQEENMFRRTDCHFRVGPEEFDAERDRYLGHMTRLLSARDGLVYLDVKSPRVCIRGPEDRSVAGLGYAWLPDGDVFPFYELRAAAQDLRDGSVFDADDARRRIAAQFETLRISGLRHAILGAFGCGAFGNPAASVAQIYRDEITARARDLDFVAFAIYSAGYGPDNFAPFAKVFS